MTDVHTAASTRLRVLLELLINTNEHVMEGLELHAALRNLKQELPPFLRTLLVADGTVTMAIEAYFDEAVEVATVAQFVVPVPGVLSALDVKEGEDILYREVVLRGSNTKTIYASAYSMIKKTAIRPELFDALLGEKVGIGTLLRNAAKGSYREILRMGIGSFNNSGNFNSEDPSPNRSYRVFLDAQPAMLINEFFPLPAYLAGKV